MNTPPDLTEDQEPNDADTAIRLAKPNEDEVDDIYAIVEGELLPTLPADLFIPPEAMRVFLETFEGPLDLLLYLIQKQNFDILNIPIAEITRQYLQYIELMQELQLDLAAEYLVMASMLMEIKSRMLLPSDIEDDDETEQGKDPRSKLVKQLQEYARFKAAAESMAELPQLNRNYFLANIEPPSLPQEIILPKVELPQVLLAMQEVMERVVFFTSHQISREPLSVRERMTLILERLKNYPKIEFVSLFTIEEGRAGAVVTLLAILELTKEKLILISQPNCFEPIYVTPAEPNEFTDLSTPATA